MHLFTIEGEKVLSFFSQSEKAEEFQMTVRVGVGFDVDDDALLYAVQPVDYKIGVFTRNGEQQRVMDVSPLPEHFRAPTEPQPDPQEDREGVLEWLETVDAPRNVFIAGDDVLAVTVQKGGANSEDSTVDFVEKSSGHLIGSTSIAGIVAHADPDRGWIYVVEPQDESVTMLRAYRVEDLIE